MSVDNPSRLNRLPPEILEKIITPVNEDRAFKEVMELNAEIRNITKVENKSDR